MRCNSYGNRALISAILLQAISDSVSKGKESDHDNAIRFIDEKNLLFDYYCNLLGIDPEYAAKRIRIALSKDKFGIAKNIKR